MNIHVTIDRIILEGLPVDRSQRQVIGAAVEAELTRLLQAGGLAETLTAGGAFPMLRAASIALAPRPEPAQMGSQIAQAVYHGLGQAQGAKR